MKNSLSWRIYKWVFLIGLLNSFEAYFFWWMPMFLMPTAMVFVGFITYSISPKMFSISNKNYITWFVILLLSTFFQQIHSNLNGNIAAILKTLPLYFILIIKTPYIIDFFNFIKKWISIILLVSVVGWILYLLGLTIPYRMAEYGFSSGDAQYTFYNHYLFLRNANVFYLFERFQSVFLEPGYLGCLISIFLAIDGYQFNKKNLPLWLSLFFTFSLAGWLITMFGLLVTKLINNKYRVAWIILFGAVLTAFYFFFENYKGGDNWVNLAVFNRLELDTSTGTIVGNNRTTEYTRDYFWNNFITSDRVLFGNTSFSLDNNDASVLGYIISHGLVAVLVYIFYLAYPLFKYKEKKYGLFILFVVYILIFSQTSYFFDSMLYMALYIMGCSIIVNSSSTLSNSSRHSFHHS